jgi:hypothetical protein
MHIDDLIRVAVDGDFNFVSVRGELGKIYVAETSHRGHSGPSDDLITFPLTETAYLVLTAQMRFAPTTVAGFSAGSLAEIERIGVPWPTYCSSEQLIRSSAAGDGRQSRALAANELLARFANSDEGRRRAAGNVATIDIAVGRIDDGLNRFPGRREGRASDS